MKVVFRVDASLEIGGGHTMRCLTLADALSKRGADIVFIVREHLGHLGELIKQKGYIVYRLPLSNESNKLNQKEAIKESDRLFHSAWLGVSQSQDALDCQPVLDKLRPEWLIVDHYAIDYRWQKILKSYYHKLMVIDDLADRMHDCDLLLDQNLGSTMKDYRTLVPDNCTILVGPHYALLRPEFSALRQCSLNRRKQPKLEHLLITMGGVDKDNVTSQVLEALKACPLPSNCQISVVMGSQSPWLKQVREIVSSMPWPTDLLVNTSDMAQLMTDCDLCIGAAGSTAWERCCLGLPTLIVVLADNQKDIASALEKVGACLKMGEATESYFHQRVVNAVSEVIKDTALLRFMTESAANVTDGSGIKIILGRLLSEEGK